MQYFHKNENSYLYHVEKYLQSIMFQNENFFHSSHYVFCEKATRYYSISISWSTTLVIGERGYELGAVNAIKRICSKIIHYKVHVTLT